MVFGLCDIAHFGVGYLYLLELCKKSQRPFFGFIGLLFDASAMLGVSVFFLYFKDMKILLWICMALISFMTLLLYFAVPESPHFLYSSGRREEFIQVLKNHGTLKDESELLGLENSLIISYN
jgi:hypothetical protein